MGTRIVLDTNVLVAALRSSAGASHAILQRVHERKLTPLLSVPLLMEYEDVLKRPGLLPHLSESDIDVVLDQFASRAVEQRIYFAWRPFLPDPKDDMLVELALAGKASHVITHNVRDLTPARKLGLRILTPRDFIAEATIHDIAYHPDS